MKLRKLIWENSLMGFLIHLKTVAAEGLLRKRRKKRNKAHLERSRVKLLLPPQTLAVVPLQKQFISLEAQENRFPVAAFRFFQCKYQGIGILRQVVNALIVLACAPVGEVMAMPTPKGPLPRR